MMLLELRDYIKQRQLVNLHELAKHFQRDPEMIRHMMAHWLRKGVVKIAPKASACGAPCGSCQSSVSENYCFIEHC